MMHHASSIVFISDLKGRPFREYDHRKSNDSSFNPFGATSHARVVMPFGTEYRFNFKFDDGRRRRLELTIDGALVTKDLIVSNGTSLERFVDSDRRFKVAPVTDAGVADPKSSDNGSVIVKLWAEKRPLYRSCLRGMNYDVSKSAETFSCAAGGSSAGDMMLGSVLSDRTEKAATVEGAKSEQRFGQTSWDEEEPLPEVFLFTLHGKNDADIRSGFCSCCGTEKASSIARFCHKCGEKLQPC